MKTKGFTYQVKDLDDKQGIIKAYANAYGNEDSDKDISEPGSFVKTISEGVKKLRVLYNHDRRIKLGVPLAVDANDPYGLLTTTQFNLEKEIARDVFTDIQLELKQGQHSDLSIGYAVVRRDQKDQRRITEYKLMEYSFLSFLGANPLAIVQDVKSLTDATPQQIISTIKQLTEMYNANYSDGKLSQIESALKTLDQVAPVISTLPDDAVASEIKAWLVKSQFKNYLQNGN